MAARGSAPGRDADVVIVSPHWGPNMRAEPVAHVRRPRRPGGSGSDARRRAFGTRPAGPRGRTLFDLGDFIDDYSVDPLIRNDLGLLWLITLDAGGPLRVEGVPLKLDFAHTRQASHVEVTLLLALLEERCAAVGSSVRREGGRLVFETGRAVSRQPRE